MPVERDKNALLTATPNGSTVGSPGKPIPQVLANPLTRKNRGDKAHKGDLGSAIKEHVPAAPTREGRYLEVGKTAEEASPCSAPKHEQVPSSAHVPNQIARAPENASRQISVGGAFCPDGAGACATGTRCAALRGESGAFVVPYIRQD